MCLAIPGQLESIAEHDNDLMRSGVVRFGGITKQVNLAYVPDAQVGDYVLVHVGFAISIVDAAEAARIFSYLETIGELEELEEPADETAP